jgi:hypothetical protein
MSIAQSSPMTTTNNNRTGVLARLLASENIRVVHDASVPSAAFELNTRTLILPMWKCDKVVYDFLVGHEVAHAKYTPAERWRVEAERIGGANARIAQDYINVIEDARIERLIKREFPGLRSDFMQGYKSLLEMDIFQTKGKDLATLSLIDRINLYYKIGIHCGVHVPFTAEEQLILNRISATRAGEIGFDDVVKIAEELFKAACGENKPQQGGSKDKSKGKSEQSDLSQTSQSSQDGNDDSEDGEEEGESESQSQDNGEEEGESQSNRQQQSSDEGDGEAEGSEGSEGEDGEDSGESMEDDTDDGESAESVNAKQTSNGQQGAESGTGKPTEVSTNGAMQKGMEKFVDMNTVEHVITIGTIDPRKVVIGVDDFIKLVDGNVKGCRYGTLNGAMPLRVAAAVEERSARLFKRICDENKRNVDMMCKRFDVKRSARNFAKQTSAKSGRISTRLLSKYKFSEDIFDRVVIRNDEKNHGIVILIDWSGSIGSMIAETCAQVCALLMFCRRAGIAAEVYFFTTSHVPVCDKWFAEANPNANTKETNRHTCASWGSAVSGIKWDPKTESARFSDYICNLPEGTTAKGNHAMFFPFSLIKVYEQGMNNKKFTRAIGRLLLVSHMMSRACEETRDLALDTALQLGGTPLDESILAMREIVKDFRKSSNTKVTLINLTDGEGVSVTRKVEEKKVNYKTVNRVVVDDATGRRFTDAYGNDSHSQVMEMFRDTTGVQAVGIFITRGSYGPTGISVFNKAMCTNEKFYTKDRYGYSNLNAEGMKFTEQCDKSFKTDSYFAFEYKPYDMYFVVNLPDRERAKRELAAQEQKNSQLKNQKTAATRTFIAKMKAEETNRMFINRLMDIIA